MYGKLERVGHFAQQVQIRAAVKKYLVLRVEMVEKVAPIAVFVEHVTVDMMGKQKLDSIFRVKEPLLYLFLRKYPDLEDRHDTTYRDKDNFADFAHMQDVK